MPLSWNLTSDRRKENTEHGDYQRDIPQSIGNGEGSIKHAHCLAMNIVVVKNTLRTKPWHFPACFSAQ